MKKEISLSRAHRVVNHGPVVLVTSQSEEGRPNAMAVAWVTPVCQEPPMAAVSIAKTHHSHALIVQSGEFVINVPAARMVDKVMQCGKVSGRDADKFRETGLTPSPAKRVKPPLIEECIGHLECRVNQSVDVEDHTLFVGRVLAAWAEEELFEDLWKIGEAAVEGLHHLGGRVFAVSMRRVEV